MDRCIHPQSSPFSAHAASVTHNHAKSSCGGQVFSMGTSIFAGAWVTLWGAGQQEEGTSHPWVHVSSLESLGQRGG